MPAAQCAPGRDRADTGHDNLMLNAGCQLGDHRNRP